MPVAKIHLLEGQYSEARLDKVSNAIQEALVGYRHGGYAIFTHPLLAEGLNTLFAMFDG
jgi:hypothetical protein